MSIEKAAYVPSLIFHDRGENLVRDWLSANCRWDVSQWGNKAELFADFTAFCAGRETTTGEGFEPWLRKLGHEISSTGVRGILLRPKGESSTRLAAPPATQRSYRGTETAVSASLIEANGGAPKPQPKAIEKDDTDIEAYRKMQYNAELLKK